MKSVPRVFARLTAIRQSIHYPVIFLLLALSCPWLAYGGDSNTLALSGPRSLQARFRGEDAVVRALASAHATPLSLAAEDFDMDGVRDLAAGYATPEGGRVAIFGGNLDAFAPQSEASFWAIGRGEFPLPFLPDVQVLAVPTQPDFLAAGMFIGHDGPGLIVAARGSNTIYVLARDESGQFQVQQTITLPGAITALGAARLNQGQYTEVVVGIRGASGAAALLRYTGSNDGLGQAQSVALADDAAGFAFGDLDGDGRQDVLVVAGGAVSILHTRDGSLEEVPVSFVVKAAALGSFVFDRSSLLQMALLGDDGSVHILAHESFDARPRSLAEMRARKRQNIEHMRSLTRLGSMALPQMEPVMESWKEIESFKAVATSGALLFRTRISDHRADDVLLLDGGRLLVIAHPDSKRDDSDGSFAPGVILTQAEPYTGPAAALMERVNVDGRAGIIVLAQSELAPAVMMPLPDPTFFPNRFDDIAPRGTGSTCLNTGGVDASNDCTLREALIKANATAGTDTVMLQAGTYTLTRARNAADHSTSAQGTLEVQDSVNIIGAGQNTTIIQGGTSLSGSVDKVFSFNQDIDSFTDATVSVSNLTIRFGFNRGNVALFDGWGGAFDFDTGTTGTATLTVTNCTITNNDLNDGEGGGVALFNSNGGSGTATFSNTTIQNNNAHRNPSDGISDPNGAGNGGGLAVLFPATGTLTNTQVLSNTATQVQGTGRGVGGGIFKIGGGNLNLPLTIHGGSVSGNQSAGDAGGIFVTSALSIDQGTVINGNTAGGGGGGIWFDSGNAGESATLTKVTITGNNASGTAGSGTGVGGGMFIGSAGNPATISFSRFAGNSSAVAGSSNLFNQTTAPGSAVTATNNWWGTNAASTTISPSTSHCAPAVQQVCFDPFIVLTHMGSPQKIRINQSSTLTGDMSKDNHGASVGLANLDRIIGLSITFDAAVLGTIPQAQPETLNASAQATATFNAGGTSGVGTANATVDQAVVPVNSNLIASATELGTTATITTVGAHGFAAGTRVVISGVGVSGYNGTFSIASPTVTTFTYTAGASGLAASSGGTANAGILILQPPSSAKSFNPTTIPVNGTSTITFSITNANVVPINASFSDNLPAGLLVAATPNVVNTCGGSVTAAAGSGTISFANASVAVGTCTIKVDVQSATDNIYNNSVQVLSTDAGNGNTASASLTVINPPQIAKAFGAATIQFNGTTSLTITLNSTNVNVTLNGVAFTDSLPAGLVVATPGNLSNTCGGTATAADGSSSVSLSGANLGPAGSCTVSVTVKGVTSGVKNNSVQVTSSNGGTGNTANASINVVAPATISKAFNPVASIPLNGIATLTFTISNSNTTAAGDLTGVSFSDTLPSTTGTLVVAPAPNVSNTCNGTVTATAGTGTISLSGGSVPHGASCTLSVDVKGTAAGDAANTTGAITSTEGGTGTTSNTATLKVVAPPTIQKAFGAASIPVNGTTTVTFTITNPAANTTAENGVAFSDTLTGGLQVASTPGVSNTCGGTVTATANSTTISLSGGSIATPGTTCTVTVNVIGTQSGNLSNTTGTVSSTNGGTGATSNTANLIVANAPTIAKAFNPNQIPLNGTSSMTFTITNPNSNVQLTGVGFASPDNLPAGLVVATPGNVNNTCGGTVAAADGSSSVNLTGGTLAAGATCTLSVNVKGTTAGAKSNSVQVSSTEAGTGNTATASITVVAPPAISKAFGAASIPLGGSTSLSFTIQNPNSTTALNGIGFSDTLPAGLIISTPSGLSGSCSSGTITATQNTNVISLSGASLVASGSCSFTVNVTGTVAGSQTNTTGNVTSTEGGTGGTATASIAVVAPPAISKAFGAASIPLNGTTSLTFTLTNPAANTVAENGVAFTDTLPAGLVVATPNGLSNTCGGVATAVAGSSSISLTGGTIATSSSCTVVVTVMGTTGGVKNNTSGAVSSTNGGTGNTASASITVASADLQLTKAITAGVSGGMANTGTNVTYTITVTNNGPGAANNVTVTDTLPANLTLISCTPSVGNCAGTTANLGTLGNLASATVTIVANVNCNVADGTLIGANSAAVSSSTPDPTAGNNSSSSATFTARNPGPIIIPTVALNSLWPPNHDLVNVGLGITASNGACQAPTTFTVQVFSNEDDVTDSGGTFSPDAKDIGIGTLRLRAERDPSGDGRVYLIVVSATGAGGGVGFGTTTVVVPKSNSPANQAAVAAAAASAKAFADAHNGVPPAGYFVVGDGPIIGPKQ